MDKPTPQDPKFDEVLKKELEIIDARRSALFEGYTPPPRAADGKSPFEDVRRFALDHDLVGLAFSGGGIRSATINLGILQGMATHGMLKYLDYLSTVSGGAYIGAWLSAWIKREGDIENVERQLAPERVVEASATRYAESPADPIGHQMVLDDEPEPVRHLRAYSRYLAPRFGYLTPDAWTLVALYVRNLFITMLPLIAIGIGFVLLSRIFIWLFGLGVGGDAVLRPSASLIAFVTFLVALVIGYVYLTREQLRLADPAQRTVERSAQYYALTIVLPLIVAAVAGAWTFGYNPETMYNGPPEPRLQAAMTVALRAIGVDRLTNLGEQALLALICGLVLGASALAIGFGFWARRRPLSTGRVAGMGARAMFTGFVFGALMQIMTAQTAMQLDLRHREYYKNVPSDFDQRTIDDLKKLIKTDQFFTDVANKFECPVALRTTTFGPPLLMIVVLLAGYIEVGLAGRRFSEFDREWRARLGAMLLMAIIVWTGYFAVTLFLPTWFSFLGEKVHLTWGAIGAWVLSTVGSLIAGRNAKADAPDKFHRYLVLAADVGPYLFLIGFLALLSAAASSILQNNLSQSLIQYAQSSARWFVDDLLFWERGQFNGSLPLSLVVGATLCGLGAIALYYIIDVNLFSMHSAYANRLIRCYLGASRRKSNWAARWRNDEWLPGPTGAPTNVGQPPRRLNVFTDFDPEDDVPLTELRLDTMKVPGPLLLINTALNLVASTDLATQDRKADSFFFSPYYCGSRSTEYAASDATSRNLSLGRALTISGAAADPNMSVHQSAAQTALMTILNVRLGFWIENPHPEASLRTRRAADGNNSARVWTAAHPTIGFLAIQELLGRTNNTDPYVHLSDGGHFENLGVYELIHRRCRFIVAVDAAEDPHDCSENLANLIRLVRTDFGIEIELDTSPLRKDEKGLSKAHCVVGTIRYDEVDEFARSGTFVFIRSSLTGDEPPDIQQYRNEHPLFPHDPTADQFFTGDQFESYRALGYHIACSVFGETAQKMRRHSKFDENTRKTTLAKDWPMQRLVRDFFSNMRHRSSVTRTELDQAVTKMSSQWSALLADLGSDPNLRAFSHELYPEIDYLFSADFSDPQVVATFRVIARAIRLMEAYWMTARLDQNQNPTVNRGWMNSFRRLASTPTFFRVWPILASTFSTEFVQFCQQAFNLPDIPVHAMPLQRFRAQAPSAAMNSMIREYKQEWADRFSQYDPDDREYDMPFQAETADFGRDEQTRLIRDFGKAIDQALAGWVICLLPADELLQETPIPSACPDYPCGIALLLPDEGEDLELFLWIRGAYRSSRIGRDILENLLQRIAHVDAAVKAKLKSFSHLIARCPYRSDVPVEASLQSMWLNLFYESDFRRRREDAMRRQSSAATFVVVELPNPAAEQ